MRKPVQKNLKIFLTHQSLTGVWTILRKVKGFAVPRQQKRHLKN
jgi:hypothetical protein